MAARTVSIAVVDEDPQEYEDKNVHAIYDEIAVHFSSTRYKVSLCPYLLISTTLSLTALAHNHCIHLQHFDGVGWSGFWHWQWEIPTTPFGTAWQNLHHRTG